MVQFAEKQAGELFEKIKVANLPFSSMDLPTQPTDEYTLAAITSKTENQGRSVYVKETPYITKLNNCITIASNGNAGTAFYQTKPFTILQDSYAIKLKDKYEPDQKDHDEVYLYFTTLFNKVKPKYGWNKKAIWKRESHEVFQVPVTASGALDTEYMASYVRKIEASYVRKIEASYVRKIEAYLSVLGYKSLADCQLTQHDLDVLHSKPKMKKFKIGNLFKKLSSKYLGTGNKFDAVSKYKNTLYSVPVTYAKYDNNGIMYWAKKGDFEVHKNCISIIYNGAVSAGLVFAQQEPTGVLAESYLISLQNKKVSFKTNLYLTTALKKAIYPIYSREYLATWNKVKSDTITLPVTSSGDPDWQFMDDYITAIEKLKVLKLKQFLDHKLDFYQKVIN